MATTWKTRETWNYIFDGSVEPLSNGWIAFTNTVGDSVVTTGSTYKVQASGASNMRRNYAYPDAGGASDTGLGADFADGVILEWRAKYNLVAGSGVSQSNMYIGDSDEIIRVLYNGTATPTIGLYWSTTLKYTDSVTDITAWHTYKLEILGTSTTYYVDDVAITTITQGNTGSSTKYIRLDMRNDSTSTHTTEIDYIRYRKGTTNFAPYTMTTRTKPTTTYSGTREGLWSSSTLPWTPTYLPWQAPAPLSTSWTIRTKP
jgi:hypothetical protein